MKPVAAGAQVPTPWRFEPAKHADDRADYYLDGSFLPQWKHRVLVFTHEWSGARPMGEQWLGLDPIGQTILKRYLLNHGARRQRRELFALFSQQNSLQNCSIAIRLEIVVQVSLPSPLDLLHPPHEHESTPGWEPLTYKLIGDLNNK